MKLTIILISLLAILAALAPTVQAGWGYAQERQTKRLSKQFVKELQAQGIQSQFKFYEDGSWQIVGCVSDGLCQD